MKPTHLSLLFAVVLVACSPLQQLQERKIDTPTLGAIGKENGSFISNNFQEIGQPVLTKPVAVLVTETPFTKSKFKEYANLKSLKGEKPEMAYVDSLETKPTYYSFEIKDRIGLTTMLNNMENREVRSYLQKDDHCKMVSRISLFIHPMEVEGFYGTTETFLSTNANGSLQLELVTGKQKQIVRINKNEIFSYDLVGFCWGEDIYGNAKIETLNDNGSCPDGTEKDAQKIADEKSYLKL